MDRSRLRSAVTGTTLAAALLTGGWGGPATADPGPAVSSHGGRPGGPVVRLDTGAVRGAVSAGVARFEGIPYAAPPVGALRWRFPAPAPHWRGVRDAVAPGSPCPQIALPQLPGGSPTPGSVTEDCLFLNVWAPAVLRPGAPVLVWIHGGGNSIGTAADTDGSALARRGVVVVTMNYRLGALGFLAHPALSAEATDHASGDYGLADQQAALRWVRRNIAAFGGDARKVTLGGQSAGSADTCAHLASPTARGLFRAAIQQSGSCVTAMPAATQSAGAATGLAFATAVGCPDPATAAACLRAVPPAALVAAGGSVLTGPGLGPVSGRTMLPLPASTAWQLGRVNRVPVLAGTNHDEYRFFTSIQISLPAGPLTPATYAARIRQEFPAVADQILAAYPASAYASANIAYSTVRTDGFFACPAAGDALVYSRRVPVYQYEFADPAAPPLLFDPNLPQGAYHGGELPYVFPSASPSPLTTAGQRALSETMLRYWSAFIRTGTPNGAAAPHWPRYASRQDRAGLTQELTETAQRPTAGFVADHQCGLWSALAGTPG